ncbi:uncharacterized protein K02A2.6-like [Toxorhynchites rutilus septentrionalis]|uniref:uncharacterized protein K02A2.6-like n=1 Tax=Toxorhynchites rutilus septentrionalis TaxID=329112 RepID=UPI002479F4FE|nr:uncharacterized protein K02A2.6-like [Toxorhynchites rutilus septentrionalis]
MDSFRSVKPFDAKVDQSQLASEWRKWKRSLEYYLEASNITGQREKRNQLLHLGGVDLQDIFHNLPGVNDVPHVTIDPPYYDVAVEKLDDHFQPTRRRTYERHIFRQITQQHGERFNDFVMRLRTQANRCEFDQEHSSVLESMIIDQIAEKCLSSALRKKILEKDRSLSEVVAIGKTIEDVEAQCKELNCSDYTTKSTGEINKVGPQVHRFPRNESPRFSQKDQLNGMNMSGSKGRSNWNYWKNDKFRWTNPRQLQQANDTRICFGCGRRGHVKDSSECVAKQAQCLKCKRIGHFAKWCTKRSNEESVHAPPAKRIKAVYKDDGHEKDKEEDICYIMGQNVFRFKIGGVEIPMAIDSGAAANVVHAAAWEKLKSASAKVKYQPQVDRLFKAYGSKNPLKMMGMFKAKIEAGGNCTEAVFYIAQDGKQCLLGDETAKKLKVLKIGFQVAEISENNPMFPKMRGILIEIPIDPNVKPVQQPYRRVPFSIEEKVAHKLRYLLDKDIIERVQEPSAWVSPIVPVLKDSGEIRLCVDMRRANQAVLRETHPLPIIEEMFGSINGAVRFSKVDIKDAYHQVEISKRSREITTFITKQGLFRYKRLMFGISCAPELFQKVIECIVAGLDGVVVYLDDVMVFGRSQKEHDERLDALLYRLKKYEILLNKDKCVYNVDRLEFLGHELSGNGIRPTESRITAIENFRKPSNVSELRSYLGLITYVARFIPQLAEKTASLRQLLKSGEKFIWNHVHDHAFEQIKSAVCSATFLGYFNPKNTSIVITDASPTGIGAVLLQQDTNGVRRIISFASKALTEIERKYFQTEREALGIVWAVEKFRLYLLGTKFILVTDCKPLLFLFKERSKPCARIERWVLRLQAYKFEVVYKPGKENLADAISRLSVTQAVNFDVDGEACIYHLAQANIPEAISLEEVEDASSKDETIQAVFQSLETNTWDECMKEYKLVRFELCRSGNILLRGDRLVIPQVLQSRTIEIAHESHPGIVVMKRRLRQKVWWPHIDKHVEDFVKKCKGCTLVSMPDPPEPLVRTELPNRAWAHIAADFVGPLPSGHNLLVFVDYCSRFTEVIIMKQITATLTVKALHETFCRFGMPDSLKTDNGPQFISAEMQRFCTQFGIEHRKTTPYWPQANGEVERINRSIGKRLKISQETEGSDWKWDLRMFILMHNSTPHSTTAIAPSSIMFGRVLKDKLPSMIWKHDIILEEIRDRDNMRKSKEAEYADKRRGARPSEITVGDTVVVKRILKENKLSTNFDPEEYWVKAKRGADVTLESKESGRIFHRNVSHMKKLFSGDTQGQNKISKNTEDTNLNNDDFVTVDEKQLELEEETNTNTRERPRRNHKRPEYLSDYNIEKISEYLNTKH